MRDVPLSQFSERLHRGRGAERSQPLVEVPLHSVFENNRTRGVFDFGVVQTRADVPEQEVFLRISGHNARNLYRIDDDGALLLEDRNRLIHDLSLRRVESAARLLGPRWRELVVEESAGYSDARAFQPFAIEIPRIIAARDARALRSRGVVGIRRRAFKDAEHDRGVGDRLGHRTWGVLVGGDGNDAVAADTTEGRLDTDEHVLIRRAQNRAGSFGADVPRPEISGGRDASDR